MPPSHPTHHPFDAHPVRPALSTLKTSKYLSPVQHQRILSWRSTSASSTPPSPTAKSAPSSISSPSDGAYSPANSSGGRTPKRQHSYYKQSKQGRGKSRATTSAPTSVPPSPQQVEHHVGGGGPAPQYNEIAPVLPIPERQMAMPKEPARISGARDPITQQ